MDIAKFNGTCRVTFPNEFQWELFSTILQNQGMTPKELARALNASHWTLKRWKLGKYSIPGAVFVKLCLMYPETSDFAQMHSPEIKSLDWGAKKGGLVTARKFGNEEMKKRMAHVRSFIKNRWVIPQPPQFTPELCEFIGTMLGDGCLSKFYIKREKRMRYCLVITGNEKTDKEYLEANVSPLIETLFGKRPRVRHDTYNGVVRVVVNSRGVFEQLHFLGLPIGKKKNLKIPESVMALPWELKRNVVKGLLDTDGCIFARRDEGYRYPYVMITSVHDGLRKQLVEMLRERGYPAYIHRNDVLVRGSANLHKWMSDIGSSNPKIVKRYEDWVKTGRMLPLGGPVAQRQIEHSGARAESTAFAC